MEAGTWREGTEEEGPGLGAGLGGGAQGPHSEEGPGYEMWGCKEVDEKDGGEDHTVRMELRAGGSGVPVGRRGPSYGMWRGGNEGKWREGMERIVRSGFGGHRRLSGNESWSLRLGSPQPRRVPAKG